MYGKGEDMANRIVVEWMDSVPKNEEGESDFDNASWRSKTFVNPTSARKYAETIAIKNQFGQVWIKHESAPSESSPEWMWERDYSMEEIVEA
jgi:hypothetical protein